MKKVVMIFAFLAFCSPMAIAVYDVHRLFSGFTHSSDTVRAFSLVFILMISAIELGLAVIMILQFVLYSRCAKLGDRRNCFLVVALGSLFGILIFSIINLFSQYSKVVIIFFFADLILLVITAVLTWLIVEDVKPDIRDANETFN